MTVAALPLLASCYQFCRTDAKTDDHFFLGFPSYWNVVAFYAVVLHWAPTTVAVVLVVCAVLVFVPVRYLYPSRTEVLWRLNLALTVVWLASYAVILLQAPHPHPVWIALSALYLIYYVGLSLYLTAREQPRGDPLPRPSAEQRLGDHPRISVRDSSIGPRPVTSTVAHGPRAVSRAARPPRPGGGVRVDDPARQVGHPERFGAGAQVLPGLQLQVERVAAGQDLRPPAAADP